MLCLVEELLKYISTILHRILAIFSVSHFELQTIPGVDDFLFIPPTRRN